MPGIDRTSYLRTSQVAQWIKNPPADVDSIPGLGRSPGGRQGNPLQYSCLENPMDRGAWLAAVHGVTKSWIRLKQLSMSTRAEEEGSERRGSWLRKKLSKEGCVAAGASFSQVPQGALQLALHQHRCDPTLREGGAHLLDPPLSDAPPPLVNHCLQCSLPARVPFEKGATLNP